MAFQKGVSGNPAGRPVSKVAAVNLRKAIADAMPEVINMLLEKAKEGDVAAAKILLDRVMPPLKPVDTPISIETFEGDSPRSVGSRIFNMMTEGELSPDAAIKALSVIAELSEIVDRQRQKDEFKKLVDSINAR